MSTWKRFLGLGVAMVLASVSVAACSSSGDDGGTATGDDDNLTAAKCGGIAGLQCKAGFDCVVTSSMPDAMGSCKKALACGGIAGIPCPANFHCVAPPGFDRSGTCVANTAPATGPACGATTCNVGDVCMQCRTTSGVVSTCMKSGQAC